MGMPIREPSADKATDDVATRIAMQTLAARGADYSSEVRRLLDAGLETMRRCGTESRPRVADIVAEARLSNDAFYRYFPSKDALVMAIVDDGAHRLASYIEHQMDKAADARDRVRSWVTGVMSQAADRDVAAATLAVMWNAGATTTGLDVSQARRLDVLSGLLVEPLAELGSADPALDASLVTAALGSRLVDHLWARSSPAAAEIDHLTGFVLACCRPDAPGGG